MCKRNCPEKKMKMLHVWFVPVLLISLLVLAAVSFGTNSKINPGESEESSSPADYQIETNADVDVETAQSDATDGTVIDTQPPIETQDVSEERTQPTVEIIQRTEAEYEKWLSATVLMCVSIEYPDFEIEGVYSDSATALDDKFSSDGVYIIFSSGGERLAIHSKALEDERTEPGTVDISSEIIDFATFDCIDPALVDTSSMEQINLEDLNEMIAQSLLVSIYTH